MSGLSPTQGSVEPERIVAMQQRHLVGMGMRMTLANHRPHELWSAFMPRHREIEGRSNELRFDVKYYDGGLDLKTFSPAVEFLKVAAVETEEGVSAPVGMANYTLPEGDYAVFLHRGPTRYFPQTMRAIFQDWLPRSAYRLADRPHFEILRPDWDPSDENGEEEIWIPITEQENETR